MGGFLPGSDAEFTANSLNAQFGAQEIANTFKTIEQLRKTFPNLLNPMASPGPREKRKQTLRFAAFQINDAIAFSDLYPAPGFNKWLKWLTWLNTQKDGTFKIDGVNFNGSAAECIVTVMAKALPPGGPAKAVHFSWAHDSSIKRLKVEATTTTTPFEIAVTSPDHSDLKDADEDDL